MAAQRRAEDEFARRKAQEEEDMKFARRLLHGPKSPPSIPKNSELADFQRKAAEELAKRKAQEEEDLELAKRLDFELNK